MNCSNLKEIIKRHRNQIPCRNVILEKKRLWNTSSRRQLKISEYRLLNLKTTVNFFRSDNSILVKQLSVLNFKRYMIKYPGVKSYQLCQLKLVHGKIYIYTHIYTKQIKKFFHLSGRYMALHLIIFSTFLSICKFILQKIKKIF